jgi:hypothetical protein
MITNSTGKSAYVCIDRSSAAVGGAVHKCCEILSDFTEFTNVESDSLA